MIKLIGNTIYVLFDDFFPLMMVILVYSMFSLCIGVESALSERSCKFNTLITYYNPVTHVSCQLVVHRDDLGK